MTTPPFAHLPLADLERRARVLGVLAAVPTTSVGDAVRHGWDNGAGDVAALFVRPDGTGLLLTFDHESPLSRYPDWDVAGQLAMLEGVPDALRALVVGQPEDDLLLAMTGADGVPVTAATGLAWFDGAAWHVPEGLVRFAAEHGHDVAADTGFRHCLGEFLLSGPFTAERVVARGSWTAADVARAFAALD